MDLMTILGIITGGAAVYYTLSEGNLLVFILNPTAIILVFGGTISSTLISYPWDTLKEALLSVRLVFIAQKNTAASREGLVEEIVSVAEKARRQGIESLQGDLAGMDERLASGMQLVVDGIEPEVVKDSLYKEILYARQQNQKISGVFRTMATLAPIFGLLGTLIGVVQILRNLSDPTNMGAAMAVAVTATFYGIFAANFIFLPISVKLNEHGESDIMSSELVAEGVVTVQQGDLPLIVRKKLDAFLLTRVREAGAGRS